MLLYMRKRIILLSLRQLFIIFQHSAAFHSIKLWTTTIAMRTTTINRLNYNALLLLPAACCRHQIYFHNKLSYISRTISRDFAQFFNVSFMPQLMVGVEWCGVAWMLNVCVWTVSQTYNFVIHIQEWLIQKSVQYF